MRGACAAIAAACRRCARTSDRRPCRRARQPVRPPPFAPLQRVPSPSPPPRHPPQDHRLLPGHLCALPVLVLRHVQRPHRGLRQRRGRGLGQHGRRPDAPDHAGAPGAPACCQDAELCRAGGAAACRKACAPPPASHALPLLRPPTPRPAQYIFSGIAAHQPDFIAWRLAYFIPGFAQVLIGLAVLAFGQDLPDGARLGGGGTATARARRLHPRGCSAARRRRHPCTRLPASPPAPADPCPRAHPAHPASPRAGNYGALRKAGKKDKAKTHMELLAAVKNYR